MRKIPIDLLNQKKIIFQFKKNTDKTIIEKVLSLLKKNNGKTAFAKLTPDYIVEFDNVQSAKKALVYLKKLNCIEDAIYDIKK